MSAKIKCGSQWPHEVNKSQFKIEYYRGSGPGGQNRNKRDTACRMTHIPTGHVTQAQEHRTQEQNKQAAFKRMCDILIPIMKKEARIERYRASQERVRTYHEKDNRVNDHRTNQQFDYDGFMQGKYFDEVVEQLLKDQNAKN